ncbi:MAG: hypothetical protein GC201_11070 [Alphaproteobacteria bacterium]|nr:hypothetical protein [Alphaproteobacteria bacterium]
MNVEKQLAGLLAREQVRDLVTSRYAFAVDWLDLEAMKDLFTADSTVSFGPASLGGHEFCDMWCNMGAGFSMRYHFVECAHVSVDGDKGRVEARAIVAGTAPDPKSETGASRDALEGSRYFFDVVKEADGAWRIAKMHITFSWTFVQPASPATAAGAPFDQGLDTSHWLYKKMTGAS